MPATAGIGGNTALAWNNYVLTSVLVAQAGGQALPVTNLQIEVGDPSTACHPLTGAV